MAAAIGNTELMKLLAALGLSPEKTFDDVLAEIEVLKAKASGTAPAPEQAPPAPNGYSNPMSKATKLSAQLDPDLVGEALDALLAGDEAKCAEILRDLIAAAASGDTAKKKAPAAEEPTDDESAPPVDDVVASKRLCRLTSTSTLREGVAHVEVLLRDNQQLTARLSEYDAAERVRLCQRLVLEGAATPGKVWNQSASELGQTPVPKSIYQRMTLNELRTHVEEEVAAVPVHQRPVRVFPHVRPPVSGSIPGGGRLVTTSRGPVEIKASEIEMLREPQYRPRGESLEQAIVDYAELKASEKAVTP